MFIFSSFDLFGSVMREILREMITIKLKKQNSFSIKKNRCSKLMFQPPGTVLSRFHSSAKNTFYVLIKMDCEGTLNLVFFTTKNQTSEIQVIWGLHFFSIQLISVFAVKNIKHKLGKKRQLYFCKIFFWLWHKEQREGLTERPKVSNSGKNEENLIVKVCESGYKFLSDLHLSFR